MASLVRIPDAGTLRCEDVHKAPAGGADYGGAEVDLSPAAGQIDGVYRQRQPGNPGRKLPIDLHSPVKGNPESPRPGDQVALEQVVRFDVAAQQVFKQLGQHRAVVVHTPQQDGLVENLQSEAVKPVQGPAALGTELARMVELGQNENRGGGKRGDHGAQGIVDSVRVAYRIAGTQPDDQIRPAGAEGFEHGFQGAVVQCQRVAAGEQDLADLGMGPHVIGRPGNLVRRSRACQVARKAPAEAVAAVHRADVGHQKGRPVRVAVNQAGRDAVPLLGLGVGLLIRQGDVLPGCGDHLPAQGIGRVGSVDK